jgi:uncharacterized protein involved in exopolysaccharide biosynthesis/Mrp family chromosome partitioning ATPase
MREDAWEWWQTLRYVARERYRVVVGGFVAGLVLALILYVFSTRIYETKATLVIGDAALFEPKDNRQNSYSVPNPVLDFLSSIRTADMARAVAEKLGVNGKNVFIRNDSGHGPDLSKHRTALIDVSSLANSRTAFVKVDSRDPQFALDAAQALLDELRQFSALAQGLTKIDSDVKLAQDKQTTLNQSLSTTIAHRIEVEQQIKMLDAHLKSGGLLEYAPPFAADPFLLEMQRKRTSLDTSLEAQETISSRGPTLSTLRAAAVSIAKQINAYSTQLALRLRALYSTNVAEEAALERNLVDLQGQLESLEQQRNEIIHSIGNARLRHSLAAADLTPDKDRDKTDSGAILVMDSPILPTHPVRPSLALFMVMGVLFGAAVGIGGALITHLADRRIRTPHQMETRSGTHCLAVLPEPMNPGESSPSLFIDQDAQPGLSYLRNLMMRSGVGSQDNRFFVFTQIGKPEDQSLWVARLALMLAKAQLRTLVVDLSFNGSRMAEILGIAPRKSLVQWFHGEGDLKDFVQYSVLQELAILHPGTPTESEDVLISRRPLSQALTELGRDWDFVLILSPSVMGDFQRLLAVPQHSVMVGMARSGGASFDDLATSVSLSRTYGLQFGGVVIHDYPRRLLNGPLSSFSLGNHRYVLKQHFDQIESMALEDEVAVPEVVAKS